MNFKNHKLIIQADGPMKEFAHFTVSNGLLETIAKGYQRIEQELPSGLYTIKMKLNESIEERTIRLEADMEQLWPTPAIYSAIVAQGFSSSHEYYTKNAEHFSKTTTSNAISICSSTLFLFFRYLDRESILKNNYDKQNLGADFILLDHNREPVTLLQGDTVKESREEGWVALHIPLSCGTYYLHYNGRNSTGNRLKDRSEPSREVILQVFEGWQTQAFMMLDKAPHFASLSISIARQTEGFNADKRRNQILDGMMLKFHNGIFFIPEEVIERLSTDKWRSPMLGLLSCYIYYSSGESKHNELFRKVLRRLACMLDEKTPDIIALKLLQAMHHKEALPNVLLQEPCMFLAGLKAAIKSCVRKEVIAPGSAAEKIVDKLFQDTIWTSYAPLPLSNIAKLKLAELEGRNGQHTTSAPPQLNSLSKESHKSHARPVKPQVTPVKTKGTTKIFKPAILDSWLANAVLSFANKANEKIDLGEVAYRLQVTPNIIKNTVNELLREEEEVVAFLERSVSKKAEGIMDAVSAVSLQKLKNIFI